MERIVTKYDVSRWVFTKEILINDDDFIPHSHPILTLNSRYLQDDLKQLSTFLHEQIHWWEESKENEIEKAIGELRKIYPVVPVGREGGARDTYSTYLHLIVCYQEYKAMTSLVGKAEATRILKEWMHYKWIYDKVLNDPIVAVINEKYGLEI